MFEAAEDIEQIGVVGSSSTTTRVTVDLLGSSVTSRLLGQLVKLEHELDNGTRQIALGTVTNITTTNQWHENPITRGLVKEVGVINGLSGSGDIRTVEVDIQAVYVADSTSDEPPREDSGALSMSPSTGTPVCRVTNQFLKDLLRGQEDEIIYLGHFYRSDLLLPLVVPHFGDRRDGGAGEAYNIGIFGMTGSGKSGLAAYLLAAYLRHRKMGILIVDPQGQFTTQNQLPFNLQEYAKSLQRKVCLYSIMDDIQLPPDTGLFADLLAKAGFFKTTWNIKHFESRVAAVTEFSDQLSKIKGWNRKTASVLLEDVIDGLLNSSDGLTKIYSTNEPQQRLRKTLESIRDNEQARQRALQIFEPTFALFSSQKPSGNAARTPLEEAIEGVLNIQNPERPLTILNVSGSRNNSDFLRGSEIKAKILQVICQRIAAQAEKRFQDNEGLNVLVVFDEAHRFASDAKEQTESGRLAHDINDYVHTTRKCGLGWMFITQETDSLYQKIYNQLKIRCFGYGLTSGPELRRLRETIGDSKAVDLYRAFADPSSPRAPAYPFMLTGPISPLSFTGTPVFLSVYTDYEAFLKDNTGQSGFPDDIQSLPASAQTKVALPPAGRKALVRSSVMDMRQYRKQEDKIPAN